jgi:hypothetical protein
MWLSATIFASVFLASAGGELAALCEPGSGNVFDAVPSGQLPDTSIRLRANDTSPSFDASGTVQGRLEVKVGSVWVTVTSDGENSFGGAGSTGGEAESTVVCRQLANELGYNLVGAGKVWREDTDDGSGMVYLLTCAGTEPTLESCTSFMPAGSNTHQYGHDFDVGVSCTFLAPGNGCEECRAGQFSGTEDSTACADCGVGSYNPSPGASSCLSCAAGTTSRTGAFGGCFEPSLLLHSVFASATSSEIFAYSKFGDNFEKVLAGAASESR